MTPKLRMLERQLNRGLPSTAEPENATSRMLMSYKAEVDREAEVTIKLVEGKLTAAQAEIASLKAQLAEAGKDTTRSVKEASYKIDSIKEVHKKEIEALCQKHYDQTGQVHDQLEMKNRECALECQAKVKAETERDEAKKMIARLEQSITKLQNDLKAKPVTSPVVDRKPPPMKLRVSQRDENGRIVEMSIMAS